MKGSAADGDVVKAAGAFADFVEADEQFSASKPCECAATGETLQVDHEIKGLFAQPLNAAEHFRPKHWPSPAIPFKANDARQVRIILQDWCEARLNPPVDFAVRPVKL